MYKLFGIFVALTTAVSAADINMWVDDSSGIIGEVNVATGGVSLVGPSGVVLYDIAFSPSGGLYGVDSTDLYSLNVNTGKATVIGSLGVSGATSSLVFAPDGTLYAASDQLLRIDPTTGHATVIGNLGYQAGGDLAFVNGTLYVATSSNQLVSVNTSTGAGTLVGNIGVSNVLGLATPGNGTLYGVAGTSVYFINTSTGAGTFDVNYAGQGLGTAFGESFISEAAPPSSVPEPSVLSLLALVSILVLVSKKFFSRQFQSD